MSVDDAHYDVVVVGGGPSGAACAFWLAQAGQEVLLVEKKHFPREKTCGDGLTPRAVRQLADMGLSAELEGHLRIDGLRSVAFGKTLELPWPIHPDYPRFGYVVTRKDLDHVVANRAVKAGATLWEGCEAGDPEVEPNGAVESVPVTNRESGETTSVSCKYLVIADGAKGRLGRGLGSRRDRSYPQGLAIRGYFDSPRHGEPWIESHLDIRDKQGDVLPGYGWIFPVGDGRVNVGVGLLSTFDRWKDVNTTHLMESFVAQVGPFWGFGPENSCGPPIGGRLPMGFAVAPNSGPNFLLVGDSAASINPFNGEGIAYAYETGKIAAEVLNDALTGSGASALASYDARLQKTYGLYFKVARKFVKVIGHPRIMKSLVSTGMHSESLMAWLLRIMSNMLRPDETGPAEVAYKSLVQLSKLRA